MPKHRIIAPIHYLYSLRRDPLPKQITLSGDYKVRPFNRTVLDSVFDFFGESYSELDKRELNNCKYAVYFEYNAPRHATTVPENVNKNINEMMQVLRIIKPSRSLASQLHFVMEGRNYVPVQIIHKPNENITYPNSHAGVAQHFSKADARKIRSYWSEVTTLYDTYGGKYHRVLNALIFFEVAQLNHLYKPRFVNFVTCLESLFNLNDAAIGNTISLRCAKFLAKSNIELPVLYTTLREVYKLRSHFVHGQSTPKRILTDDTYAMQLLIDVESICRRCLQKVLDKKLLSIFNDKNMLESEFVKLDLGLKNELV